MRWFLFLLLAACGGGNSGDALPPAPQRHDLLYGYYGDYGLTETFDHTNMSWVSGWGEDYPGQHALQAAQAGKSIVLAVCWRCGADGLRYHFGLLRTLGAINRVVAIYPEDEPSMHLTGPEIAAMVILVRSVVSEFVELAGVRLAAIYGGSHPYIGAENFELVGIDCYPNLCQAPLLPGQQMILVPGGADPWRTDPQAALDIANRNPKVGMIVPFLWRWPDHPATGGIATNGMADQYRAAGMAILH